MSDIEYLLHIEGKGEEQDYEVRMKAKFLPRVGDSFWFDGFEGIRDEPDIFWQDFYVVRRVCYSSDLRHDEKEDALAGEVADLPEVYVEPEDI